MVAHFGIVLYFVSTNENAAMKRTLYLEDSKLHPWSGLMASTWISSMKTLLQVISDMPKCKLFRLPLHNEGYGRVSQWSTQRIPFLPSKFPNWFEAPTCLLPVNGKFFFPCHWHQTLSSWWEWMCHSRKPRRCINDRLAFHLHRRSCYSAYWFAVAVTGTLKGADGNICCETSPLSYGQVISQSIIHKHEITDESIMPESSYKEVWNMSPWGSTGHRFESRLEEGNKRWQMTVLVQS